ncbi:hypothetical protein [Nocardioides daedukensis]|uniref:hypothetical protein n=1 Tax=Nocardioides daedukensis TaxID=634462 RepID=UPI0015CCAD5A
MSRRVSLPAADDLFRPTSTKTGNSDPAPKLAAAPEPVEDEAEEPTPRRKSSGRIRHDEKMTVYVTSDELLEIEHARLTLRRSTGKAVDRGRLVRAAIAMALAEFEERGEESDLAARLRDS